ncbi:MAG: hypothetical protein Q8P24_19700, partial [Desulfobacterales bacterium]|nr:hypothetical protein [Desulfobacterales bacterium]
MLKLKQTAQLCSLVIFLILLPGCKTHGQDVIGEGTSLPYFAKREQMVVHQIKRRGIKDPKIINAFLKVERHRFVPQRYLPNAYEDRPLPIGEGQTISQPYIVAFMTEV